MLLLAGSAEATALAARLGARGIPTEAALAGRTRDPGALAVPVRVGGFGGVDGLVDALMTGGHRVLVDATHPFAAAMQAQAATAADRAGVARLRVSRPPWVPGPGDVWHEVDDLDAAARRLAGLGARRALLALGSRHLAPFAGLDGVAVVIRAIEPPEVALPADAEVILARPPFSVADEVALLRERAIDVVVARNSGAEATAAKLRAARLLGLPVVLVRRPPVPPGPVVPDADAALRWIEAALAGDK